MRLTACGAPVRAGVPLWILVICVGCAALAVPCVASAETGTVTASSLMLRAGPSMDAQTLGEIPGGTVLELLEYRDGWYRVVYGEQHGYVSARYVRVALPSATATPTPWAVTTPQPTAWQSTSWTPQPTQTAAAETDDSVLVQWLLELLLDALASRETAQPTPTALPGLTAQPFQTASPYQAAGAQALEKTDLSGLDLPELSFTGENNPNYPDVMKPGDMGNSVIDLQKTLRAMGYDVETDGKYGYDTQAAVMKIQLSMAIDADGLVGTETRRLIGSNQSERDGVVELLDWHLGGNVAITRLGSASIVDVGSGKRFSVSRYGGDNHCDVEPLTQSDTDIMRSIVGEWTWTPRPVWVEVNGRVLCGSMSWMPQDAEHITDNGVEGHFCLHLLGSRTHEPDKVDEAHAACVQEAWEKRAQYAR